MESINVTVENIAFGGEGVARFEGKVVFVPGTIQGEEVKIRLSSESKNFSRGFVEEILTPSPHRIEPDCPYYMKCGDGIGLHCNGCCYRHMAYDRETAAKARQLSDLLTRTARISDHPRIDVMPSESADHYRNKIVLHSDGSSTLGFFAQDNKTIIDIAECKLAQSQISQKLSEFRASANFPTMITQHKNITFRHTEKDGCMVWGGKPDPLLLLTEDTSMGPFTVPRASFSQVNTGTARNLVQYVQQLVKNYAPDIFIDLYCGTGIFAIAASDAGIETVFGVELDSAAVDCAVANAGKICNGRGTFICAPAVKGFKTIISAAGRLNKGLILVDPPRRGIDPSLLRLITETACPHVIYVSCSPDTLARDIKMLGYEGFGLETIQLIDMFPRTAFFETVAVLTRSP